MSSGQKDSINGAGGERGGMYVAEISGDEDVVIEPHTLETSTTRWKAREKPIYFQPDMLSPPDFSCPKFPAQIRSFVIRA